MVSSTLAIQAADLVQSLADQCSQPRGFGSMSSSIYDTAWVSMLRKPIGHESYWLFPESFERVFESQCEDGGWVSYTSHVDRILNTAAALLAVRKHLNDPTADAFDLELRSTKAEAALGEMLDSLDVVSCDQVGFEVLVTRHLDFLEEEGIMFNLPVRRSLKALERAKLAKLPPSYVETIPSTLIHSLEALVGKVDFGRMNHLRSEGSMMASPSSTAAYLMNLPIWDDEAEAYLRAVLGRPTKSCYGLVPCAWPTTIFELSWVITVLLESGFPKEELGESALATIGEVLEKSFVEQNGLVGFAPSYLPDADDTSRTILALEGLGSNASPDAMITTLEGASHFLTYKGERNPSFSTNCNVAACLLSQENPARYSTQIKKCIQFLCKHAFASGIKDKWNMSAIYPKMLLSQKLLRLLTCLDEGSVEWGLIPKVLLEEEIPIITWQILGQLLHLQEANGSWDSKHEVTAYAVLALTALSSFSWMQTLASTINSIVASGKRFLDQHRDLWSHGDYLWIEKVTYASGTLSLGYCLSAAKAIPLTRNWEPAVAALNNIPTKALSGFSQFFLGIPLFSHTPVEQIQAAFIQGHYFLSSLSRQTLDIFPRRPNSKDSYLKYVPFTWTSCNHLAGGILEPLLLQDMMILSVLIYQADEFMETVVEQEFGDNLGSVRIIISDLCSSMTVDAVPGAGTDIKLAQNGFENGSKSELDFTEVESPLRKFIHHVLRHPKALNSHRRLQVLLARELETFLLAHVTHAEDNAKFAAQRQATAAGTDSAIAFTNPRRTYYQWVRSTSADHTSCPFAFIFFSCLFAPARTDPFPGP